MQTCFICLDDVSTQTTIFEWCGQWQYLQKCSCVFYAHNRCFQKWYLHSGKCPYCKNEIYIRYFYYWQYYGIPISYYGLHIILTLWTLYSVYKAIFDIHVYDLYYEPNEFS
jgi:prepilin signal peptidase PulO-like enzyme (type II secretory pathway)